MAILIAMVLVAVAFSYRRPSSGIPAVETCSWAISAACHDIGGESDVEFPSRLMREGRSSADWALHSKPIVWQIVRASESKESGVAA
jgi:hypothetical protein